MAAWTFPPFLANYSLGEENVSRLRNAFNLDIKHASESQPLGPDTEDPEEDCVELARDLKRVLLTHRPLKYLYPGLQGKRFALKYNEPIAIVGMIAQGDSPGKWLQGLTKLKAEGADLMKPGLWLIDYTDAGPSPYRLV